MANTALDAQRGKHRSLEGHMSDHIIPVRLSHLMRHSTVGAIVRGEKHLMVVKDTRFWFPPGQTPPSIPYVERVRQALGITKRLCQPPTGNLTDKGEVEGSWIAATLFPQWTYCPSCGLLHHRPWRQQASAERWTCRNAQCRKDLEQVPWVMVHADGYLGDVPMHSIAHAQQDPNDRACRADWNEPYLRLQDEESRRWVVCTRCQARNLLPDRFPYPTNAWQQPWVNQPPPVAPDEPAWILGINDVRVHVANTSAALVIPPESRIRKGTVVDRLYCNPHWQRDLRTAQTSLQRKSTLKRIASRCRCTVENVERAWEEIHHKGYPLHGENLVDDDLLAAEYQALTHPVPNLNEGEDFVTQHHTDGWSAMGRTTEGTPLQAIKIVERLVEVRRLKEVLVLRGFARLGSEMKNLPPDVTHETDWLPALELYGEGVFFTLDERIVSLWEQQPSLQAHANKLARRLEHVRVPALQTDVTPRFLLLHTLAHLIIRQLETEAGYPAASLKERIYCEVGHRPMAGILIYVAVPDEVGSLGGLGEMALPSRFLRILTDAWHAAAWCSQDPVCSSHDGRGPHLLNRVACHACALIPEPSCLFGNVLLDRTFLKRDPKAQIKSILDFTGDT